MTRKTVKSSNGKTMYVLTADTPQEQAKFYNGEEVKVRNVRDAKTQI